MTYQIGGGTVVGQEFIVLYSTDDLYKKNTETKNIGFD